MTSKHATHELVDVENAPPQEGNAFTNQYFNSSNMSLALEN